MRDRWLALGLGRPMRIHSDDCDIQMPEARDLTAELEQLAPEVVDIYLPKYMGLQADIWVRQIRLSHILGRILQAEYRISKTCPDSEVIRGLEAELEDCRIGQEDGSQSEDISTTLSRLQFELFLE
jgi:hypothetical protein